MTEHGEIANSIDVIRKDRVSLYSLVLQRVKRGELRAIHVHNGRRKGCLRIQVISRDESHCLTQP